MPLPYGAPPCQASMEATLEVTQAAMKLLEARVLGHSDTLVRIALHSAARPPIRTALGSRWVSITIAPPLPQPTGGAGL